MTAPFGKRCPREQRSLFELFSWFERSVLTGPLNVPREAAPMQQHAGKFALDFLRTKSPSATWPHGRH